MQVIFIATQFNHLLIPLPYEPRKSSNPNKIMSKEKEFVSATLRNIPKKLHREIIMYRARRVLEIQKELNMNDAYIELMELGLSSKNY